MKRKTSNTYYRDEEFLKHLGERIRDLRIKKGLTQVELAFRCNDVDYSQINRIELGKVNFSVSYLKLLATALEVSINEFFFEIEDLEDLELP